MFSEKQIKKIENKIGYSFKNKCLLEQAFVKTSYALHKGCNDNEILEFYGDRILDYLIIRKFNVQYGSINQRNEYCCSKTVGELAEIDAKLVSNSMLASRTSEKNLLIYLKSEKQRERRNNKNKADLFEAILGAVAIDSDWNINVIDKVYCSLMDFDFIRDDTDLEKINFIQLFRNELFLNQILVTSFKCLKTQTNYLCSSVMLINGKGVNLQGGGTTEEEAKMEMSKSGYYILRLYYYGEISERESYTHQLQLLTAHSLVNKVDMHFEYFPQDNEEESIWKGYGSFINSDTEYEVTDNTLAGAKDQLSYALLCEALGITEEPVSEMDETQEVHGQGLLKLIMSKYVTELAA